MALRGFRAGKVQADRPHAYDHRQLERLGSALAAADGPHNTKSPGIRSIRERGGPGEIPDLAGRIASLEVDAAFAEANGLIFWLDCLRSSLTVLRAAEVPA